MTTLAPNPAPSATDPGTRVGLGLLVTGAVFAGNGVILGSQLFFDSRAYSEVAVGTGHLAHYLLWTLCLVALTQLYPRMGHLRSPIGRSLPAPLLAAAGAGAALDACARFVSAFVTPYLAEHDAQLVDVAPDPVLLVPLLATGVVAMVATGTLAVVGLRRRVFPGPAAVLLLLGAIAIPVLGPVSNVLLGAALVWIGWASRGGR